MTDILEGIDIIAGDDLWQSVGADSEAEYEAIIAEYMEENNLTFL